MQSVEASPASKVTGEHLGLGIGHGTLHHKRHCTVQRYFFNLQEFIRVQMLFCR